MALKTKKEVVDEILYEVYAGTPPDNASISVNFVLRGVNNLIAESAMKSAFQNSTLEGVTCADDIFYLDYKSLPLVNDASKGLKYVELPAQPVGLPRNRAIRVYPNDDLNLRASSFFKPIDAKDVAKILNLPKTLRVYHFTEGLREYFISRNKWFNSYTSVNMSMASSGANDLTAYLNMPDDMIMAMKVTMVADCRKMMGIADALPNTNQTPQPR